MTKLDTALKDLKRTLKRTFKVTGAYTVHAESDGPIRVMLRRPEFNDLPGALKAKTTMRDSQLYPYGKHLQIGSITFECLLDAQEYLRKEGEA